MRFDQMIHAVDTHACGEPGRVIVGGVMDPPGDTVFQKMEFLRDHRDEIRKHMLREPRGYPALCCNLLVKPTMAEADAAFVIMEQTEYPGMSGSNTISVATVLIETGMVPAVEPVTGLTLETPAGLVKVRASVRNGKVEGVTFTNVPAFAVHLDRVIEVPELGSVTVDVAYGGMFFVLAEAAAFGLRLTPDEAGDAARIGEMIKSAAQEQIDCVHPENSGIHGITIAQLSAPPLDGGDRRNAVVVSSGQVDWQRPSTWTGVLDRSPCGTGTCARMAVMHARGLLGLHQDFHHESILGTMFTGRLIEETKVGPFPAVRPTLQGRAWITGFAQYVLDPSDPFPEGYILGDLWSGDSA